MPSLYYLIVIDVGRYITNDKQEKKHKLHFNIE